MAKKVNSKEAVQAISRREAFVGHGAMSARGHSGPGDHLLFGRLPQSVGEQMKGVKDVDYVVQSYSTPIGFHSAEHGWIIPDVKYSPTTSKHQTYLKRGAEASGRPVVKDANPKPKS
jgi:hypothetical protein